jgi:UDP-N-acetyl-D-galactosamine dehydrogenase
VDCLGKFGASVDVFDPFVSKEEAMHEYGLPVISSIASGAYDALVIAVAHDVFLEGGVEELRKFGKRKCVIYDVKSVFPRDAVDGRL